MSDSLFDAVTRQVGEWLSPIVRVAQDSASLDQFLAAAGVIVPDAQRTTLLGTLSAIAALETQIDGLLAQPSPSLGSITTVLDVARQLFAAVRGLDSVNLPGASTGLGRDLVNVLLTADLSSRHPLFRSVAALSALLELAEDLEPHPPVVQNGERIRGPFRVDRYHLDRLPSLVRDPAAALRAEYGNALATTDDANAMADKLFPRVARVFRELGVTCRYGFDENDRAGLGDTAPFLDHALIVYSDDQLAGAAAEAGIIFTISAADRGDLGLVMRPFGMLSSTRTIPGGTLDLSLTAGVDVLAFGRHGLTLLSGAATAEVGGSVAVTLAAPDEGPAFLVGAPNGSRLEVGGVHLQIDTTLSDARQSLAVSAAVSSSTLVLAGGRGRFRGELGAVRWGTGQLRSGALVVERDRAETARQRGARGDVPGRAVFRWSHPHKLASRASGQRRAREHRGVGELVGRDRPGARGRRRSWHRRRADFPRERRQPWRRRPLGGLSAPLRYRPVRGRARRAHRRRLPVPRRSAAAVRGCDAALAARRAHAHGLWAHRDEDARRATGLLAPDLHHRRGLQAGPR